MKDVLSLHDNGWPHTSLCICEAITKMEWAILPYFAYSPELALSDYHLFGPVNYALCECHFADDNKLKQSFRDVLQSQCREFTTLVYKVLLNNDKSVFKMMQTLWKNSHITAKDV
jgi:hypothetical protein